MLSGCVTSYGMCMSYSRKTKKGSCIPLGTGVVANYGEGVGRGGTKQEGRKVKFYSYKKKKKGGGGGGDRKSSQARQYHNVAAGQLF